MQDMYHPDGHYEDVDAADVLSALLQSFEGDQ